MEEQDKELLLKDLSTRLPYGVKIRLGDYDYQVCGYNAEKEMPVKIWYYYRPNIKSYIDVYLEDYRPYLRPMESMTEEEKEQMRDLWIGADTKTHATRLIDFYNKQHFDYRGLIENGLALLAPNSMYDFK